MHRSLDVADSAAARGFVAEAVAAPGPIDTGLVRQNPQAWQDAFKAHLPSRRFGRPEEVAATALLLAGPNGGFYVGACLSPNGGDVTH
ncbi:MAG: SDR family oxidoreductase [Acetobacteraceae bacterium]